MAAVLASGDGAALSHVSAAALWGLRQTSAVAIHVTVSTGAGLRQRAGIVLHRSRNLGAPELARRDGICVTTPARTLLDLAAMLAPGSLERAIEQALVLRVFDLGALHAVLGAHPNRAGAAALAELIARIEDEPSLTRSEAEAVFLELCAAHAIERPAVNNRIETSRSTSPGARSASSSRSTATGITARAPRSSAIGRATRD